MPFLSLNGLTVRLLVSNFDKGEPAIVGDRNRAINGALRETVVATKRSWRGTMAHASPADAEAWRRFLLREGWDSVSFDGTLYSGKGLAPNAGHGATLSTASPKFGTHNVATNANALTYSFALGSVWSVSLWRWSGTAWEHFVVRSDGAKWLAGTRNDAAGTTFLSVSGGSVTLAASNSFDDLAAFPFLLPATWPAEIAAATTAFTCPTLIAAGDAIEGAPRTVVPVVGNASVRPAVVGGVRYKAVETLGIELEEA